MNKNFQKIDPSTEKSFYCEVCWTSVNTGDHCEMFYEATPAIEWFEAMRSRGDNTRVIYRVIERTDYHQDGTPDYFMFFTEKVTRETVYINKKLLAQLYNEKKHQEG